MIRPLTLLEIPLCVPMGQRFHAELEVPGRFDPDVFIKTWTTFLTSYPSVILGWWKDEELVGGIGGLMTPDLFDGRVTATEMFWFVDATHRGGTGSIKLIRAFEEWASTQGAVEARLCYLHHRDAETDTQFRRVYDRLGYTALETSYLKPLERIVHASH